jgi:hypothetical protein
MRMSAVVRSGCCAAVVFAMTSCAPPPPLVPANQPTFRLVFLDQGPNWTQTARSDVYSRDQGSRIMPLRWMQALKQPNGDPFMAASLGRYGYLPNSEIPGMPIGFTVAGSSGREIIGMTCSACHTRQITVADTAYRVDGGPAIVDFQSFLADLDTAVNTALTNEAAFSEFAEAVVGRPPTPEERANLHQEVNDWFFPYHTLMTRALPANGWGPGRLDAVAMIFNRVTGLDIGPSPSRIIVENIRRADAPVRYPFLWNSPVQDKTQWPGFADNGNDILGLSRNLGEVYGVFAVYRPKKDRWHLLGVDYLNENSKGIRHSELDRRQWRPQRRRDPVSSFSAPAARQVCEDPRSIGRRIDPARICPAYGTAGTNAPAINPDTGNFRPQRRIQHDAGP